MDENFFVSGTPESAWVAGLLAADGCVGKNLRYWSLAQSGDDGREVIDQVVVIVGYKNKVYTTSTTHKDSHAISVTCPKQVADLQTAWGIGIRKSLVLEWPFPSQEDASAFCRGYFEGDGSIGVYWTGTTNVLTLSVAGTHSFLAGFSDSAPHQSNHIRPIANIFELRWYGEKASEVMGWLLSDSSLPDTRKTRLYRDYMATSMPQWRKYASVRETVSALLDEGMPIMRVAEKVDMSFSTIYRWKKKGLV